MRSLAHVLQASVMGFGVQECRVEGEGVSCLGCVGLGFQRLMRQGEELSVWPYQARFRQRLGAQEKAISYLPCSFSLWP